MTTIINLETSTYQLPLSFRWMLVLACLLVTVSLQSCRTAAISATALDLNNYQTGKTLPVGTMAAFGQIAYTPSVIGGVDNGQVRQNISSIPLAIATAGGVELGIAQGWNIGLAGQISSTKLFFDMDAGFKGFVKTSLSDDTLSPVSVALMINGGILWGTESNTKDVSYELWPFGPGLISIRDTITHSIISSQVNRIGLAIPVSLNLLTIRPDSLAQAASYTTLPDIDFIITPSLHLVHQNLYLQDTTYLYSTKNGKLTPLTSGSRVLSQPYLVPSLSIGINVNTSSFSIFPEFIASWTHLNGFTFGFGICIRQTGMKF